MGMTLTEKILARKTGQAKVSPGDMVTVGVDTVVLVDTMFAPGRWRTIKKLDNPERVIVVLDHRAPTPDKQGAASHQTARKFVEVLLDPSGRGTAGRRSWSAARDPRTRRSGSRSSRCPSKS